MITYVSTVSVVGSVELLRAEVQPRVRVRADVDRRVPVEALHGVEGADPMSDRLVAATFRDHATKTSKRCDAAFLFLFIGAAPFTGWLPKEMSCDQKGFVKTGPDLSNLDLVKAGWSLDRMPTRYETSWPRIYAVGDVRIGSVKRVASSVAVAARSSAIVSLVARIRSPSIHRTACSTAPARWSRSGTRR